MGVLFWFLGLLPFLVQGYGSNSESILEKENDNIKTIHVFVALCDNDYQGIVKVPRAIGNGQDPHQNLYWGCGYGVRTYFDKSSFWKRVYSSKSKTRPVLERIIWKNSKGDYLIADAYDGRDMEQCLTDYFMATTGKRGFTVYLSDSTNLAYTRPSLTAFVGHNGLMDIVPEMPAKSKANDSIPSILLCCMAKGYFDEYLKTVKAWPLVWTTNLMAPEAYTLHAVVNAWADGKTGKEAAEAGAQAYHKYQQCGIKGARRLLVSGF